MSKPSNPRQILTQLIRRYYRREVAGATRTARSDRDSPHLRLQDWRVVEEVSVRSTKYVLLRRVPSPKYGFGSLTAREFDTVRRACTGASNKEIAYEMGISDSTVRVLLSRASKKLRAMDRDELIRSFRAQNGRSSPGSMYGMPHR
jgi:DNA-binding CsgD family transcriptional regulator